jgi:hypothetical protein
MTSKVGDLEFIIKTVFDDGVDRVLRDSAGVLDRAALMNVSSLVYDATNGGVGCNADTLYSELMYRVNSFLADKVTELLALVVSRQRALHQLAAIALEYDGQYDEGMARLHQNNSVDGGLEAARGVLVAFNNLYSCYMKSVAVILQMFHHVDLQTRTVGTVVYGCPSLYYSLVHAFRTNMYEAGASSSAAGAGMNTNSPLLLPETCTMFQVAIEYSPPQHHLRGALTVAALTVATAAIKGAVYQHRTNKQHHEGNEQRQSVEEAGDLVLHGDYYKTSRAALHTYLRCVVELGLDDTAYAPAPSAWSSNNKTKKEEGGSPDWQSFVNGRQGHEEQERHLWHASWLGLYVFCYTIVLPSFLVFADVSVSL